MGCLVGRFFSGEVVRSFGFLKLLACGLILYAASTASYPFETSSEVKFVNRLVNGTAVGVIGTVTGTLAAVVTPVRYQGRGIAYFSMSTALALCIGPFLSISLLDWIGASGLFWVATVFTFCSLFLVFFVRVTKTEYRKEKKKLSIKDFIEPSIIPFCLVVALICVAWGNIQAYMGAYAEVNNVQPAAALLFVVYAVAMLVSRPFTGKICDTHSPQLVFYPSIVCLALGLICLWAGTNDFFVLLAGVLAGLGFGNITSVGQTTAVSMVPRNQYTQANSTFYIFFDMGTGLAPYLSGFLIPLAGHNGIFGLTSILAFVCIPLY
ncbi:MAG: MFS transporter [Burkholderiales bacterium]|nr:MFS transporter [Burkholderiales bacterium]